MKDFKIFKNAPNPATPEELEAYLNEACGNDQDLRAQVDELFQAHEGAAQFMNAPALDSVEGEQSVMGGPYKLLQKVGEGGFGTVYMADQVYLRQLAVADRALLRNHYPSVRRALDACGEEDREWKWRFLDQRYQTAVSLHVPGYEQPLFSSDGTNLLAIGCPGGGEAAVGIWDLATESRIGQLNTENPLQCVEMAPKNQWVAGGDKTGRLILRDFASRKEIWNSPVREDGGFFRLDGLAFSPDEQLLAATGWDGHLRVFDTSDGSLEFDVKFGGHRVRRRPRFSPDGKWIVVGSTNRGTTALVNVSDQSIRQPFPDGTIVAEFSADGRMIATGNSREKRIHLRRWNGDDGTVTHDRSWSGANSSRFFDLRFCADGAHLVNSQGVHLAVWDVDSGRSIAYLDTLRFPYWIGVNPKRNEIAYCVDDDLVVWHYTGGKDRITLPPTGTVQHMVKFSPDGQLLATGTHRGQHGASHAHQEEAGPVSRLWSKQGSLCPFYLFENVTGFGGPDKALRVFIVNLDVFALCR